MRKSGKNTIAYVRCFFSVSFKNVFMTIDKQRKKNTNEKKK